MCPYTARSHVHRFTLYLERSHIAHHDVLGRREPYRQNGAPRMYEPNGIETSMRRVHTSPRDCFFFCARRSFRSAVWSGSTSERRLATDGSDCVTAICAVFTTSARYIARLHSQCHTRLILATINLVNLIPSWYHVAVSRCRIHSDSPPTIAEAWCHTVSRSHTRRRSQRSQQVFRAESSRVVG